MRIPRRTLWRSLKKQKVLNGLFIARREEFSRPGPPARAGQKTVRHCFGYESYLVDVPRFKAFLKELEKRNTLDSEYRRVWRAKDEAAMLRVQKRLRLIERRIALRYGDALNALYRPVWIPAPYQSKVEEAIPFFNLNLFPSGDKNYGLMRRFMKAINQWEGYRPLTRSGRPQQIKLRPEIEKKLLDARDTGLGPRRVAENLFDESRSWQRTGEALKKRVSRAMRGRRVPS